VEKNRIEPFDTRMLDYFRTAPISELISRAKADYVSLRPNATRDRVSVRANPQAKVDKWVIALKPRRDEILQFLLAESEGEAEPDGDREVEIVLGDITTCPTCGSIIAPPPAIQIRNYRDWQRGMPVLWQWSDREMSRLEMTLQPGDLIIFPSYAQSCVIKRINGTLENWPRCQA
jgi:hypothetical protein